MNFKDKVFVNPSRLIDEASDVIFVSDMFVEDYVGGAELTSEALISASSLKIQKLHSRDVNLATLTQGAGKFWIFGNFSQMNPELLPSIVANLKYSILEYDYKYCRLRSPEKHQAKSGLPCDCHNQFNGKMISAFFYGATSIWWMSEKQKDRYHTLFPFLADKDNFVLSSVFSKETLAQIKLLKKHTSEQSDPRSGWIVLGSDSWVKGAKEAKDWCEKSGLQHEVIWNRPYEEVLAKLASAEGFVYLPTGGDTCPRMVIEAKLLGCKLHLNDNVQHRKEEWFDTEDLESIHEYLYAAPGLFWRTISNTINKVPSVSGYTTVYNCLTQEYPWKQAIESMVAFCDEVCVVDGGSSDGTWEDLQAMATANPKIKVKQVKRDWAHPRHAVFDGMQKAEARKMCSGDFCWQMDSDEIVHELDGPKVLDLCRKIPREVEVLSLPVIEYWGGPDKVRVDIQPWKWRLSRNLPHITHGIPKSLRRLDSEGYVCALPGTDGCDMIHAETGEVIPHVTFHTPETEKLRRAALSGNEEALKSYEAWFNQVVDSLPGVYHYSWYDIPRKMKLYKNYWTRHWNSLYDASQEDTAETNMMFDKSWSEVTDAEIEQRGAELASSTGGWIWHSKWRGQRVPHMTCQRSQPVYLKKHAV